MASIIVKLQGSELKSVIATSLHQANEKKDLPSFLKYLGEANGPSMRSASVQILNLDAVAASGTVTSAAFGSMSSGDTLQIGTMVLTAKTSGATGPQYNIGSSNNATATNIANAISANSGGVLIPSVSGAVVTVRCAVPGTLGNSIPIIITQTTSGALTSSGSLSGGSADTGIAKQFDKF